MLALVDLLVYSLSQAESGRLTELGSDGLETSGLRAGEARGDEVLVTGDRAALGGSAAVLLQLRPRRNVRRGDEVQS